MSKLLSVTEVEREARFWSLEAIIPPLLEYYNHSAAQVGEYSYNRVQRHQFGRCTYKVRRIPAYPFPLSYIRYVFSNIRSAWCKAHKRLFIRLLFPRLLF